MMTRIAKIIPIRITRGLDVCIALLLTIAGIQKCYKENIIGLLSSDNHISIATQTPKLKGQPLKDEPKAEVVNQLLHDTYFNRYPDEYQQAVRLVGDTANNHEDLKILSFGSSTGMEAKALGTLYFPKAKIFGVDVDDPTLETARQLISAEADASRYTFFNGLNQPIAHYGPYDLIFANSVLCQHPVAVPGCAVYAGGGNHETTMDCPLEKFDKVYSFATFEETLQRLDAALKEGGYLAIVNSSYEFEATDVFAKGNYEVAENAVCKSNVVPRVNRLTQRFEYHNERPCLYRKKKKQ